MTQAARRALFALALAGQLVVLYTPRGVSNPDGVPVDKLVHATIFGAVLAAGVYAGLPVRPLIVLLCLHAVGSELIQHYLLPHRAGDPGDALADVTGVAIVTGFLRARRRTVRHPG